MMDIIKYICILILVIILFQIPFLTEHENIYGVFNLIITIAIWIIGTRKIDKDTKLKKVIIYGFLILWCVFMILISYSIWGKYLRHFSLLDAGWNYSVILIFIISKVLSLQVIKEKIEYEFRDFIKIITVIFIIGILLGFFIEFILNHLSLEALNFAKELFYYINIFVFLLSIFKILKINEINQKATIFCTGGCIIILLLVNIIPIIKINNIISSQEKLRKEIVSNSHSYTYTTVSTELEKYLPKDTITKIRVQTWDYQQYDMVTKQQLGVVKTWLQDMNKSDFKYFIEAIEDFSKTIIKPLIDAGEQNRNARINSTIASIIFVVGIGTYLVLNKKKEFA